MSVWVQASCSTVGGDGGDWDPWHLFMSRWLRIHPPEQVSGPPPSILEQFACHSGTFAYSFPFGPVVDQQWVNHAQALLSETPEGRGFQWWEGWRVGSQLLQGWSQLHVLQWAVALPQAGSESSWVCFSWQTLLKTVHLLQALHYNTVMRQLCIRNTKELHASPLCLRWVRKVPLFFPAHNIPQGPGLMQEKQAWKPLTRADRKNPLLFYVWVTLIDPSRFCPRWAPIRQPPPPPAGACLHLLTPGGG